MKFKLLKDKFTRNEITKAEFIAEAHKLHQVLFEYSEIINSSDVQEIMISQDGVSFVIGEDLIRLFAPPGEARVAPIEIMNFSSYEPEETQVIDLLMEGTSQILDIGANIGWYSVRLAKRNRNAVIYAFEPMPISYEFLQKNIAANNLGNRVRSYNYGLSDVSGVFQYFLSPTGGTNASLKNVADAKDASRVTGLTLTIDEWVANQNVIPDFIKCDVEGAELLVFRGAKNTLEACKPIVFSELLRKWSQPFGYHPNDMLEYFRGFGYVCFAIGVNGSTLITTITNETIETNYAFLHKDAHSSIILRLES